ncbi:hypothetical protein DCAR_0311717 [Daucus carota subsp. sativus]|uniref:Uncharacterized protein n=1 Tax=Daucus carota subsp. sativus TaxID=79200 RepID=A0A166AN92_DAUCS|nr:PREDICTED: uncharacterized protein LOC108210703 [Daucus carota subsp. sativus]WOG92448.1 hypothetical protein DCAR_0311717 [Daucus carota subsp. sativus]
MSNLSNNSVETVNAAATAIVNAESRVQPTSVQKKRWGSCWSLPSCFGSSKPSKRIGHATLVPEPTVPASAAPVTETVNHTSTTAFPFIAPPSSPSSLLQSDPSSAIQTPGGLMSLTSLSANVRSQGGSIFAIGPYAYETQLVSPPVFSTFTTEPSTASFTPPPEPVQLTTPSSPEVPFAQLLASSLAHPLSRPRRNSGPNQKFLLSQYEYQPYQVGSPGSYLISPGSTIPNSGTSTPFPDKLPLIEFQVGETPKSLGYEYYTSQKWGSRLGSGSMTPNGLGSRLGSGSLTPNGGVSRLGSGSLTPNDLNSKAGSGSMTPTEPVSKDDLIVNQISEVASLANSDSGSQDEEIVIGHRVSFELRCEDVETCLKKNLNSTEETVSEFQHDVTVQCARTDKEVSDKAMNTCNCGGESEAIMPGKAIEGHEKQCLCKNNSGRHGSSKEFKFDSTKSDEWWTSDKVVGKESGSKNWTFFPMLQPELS